MLGEVDAARGGFLNADLLVMFRDGDAGMHDLLALDVSAFATGGETIGEDLLSGGALLHMLEDEAFYQAERGGFARLSIEANAATGSLFTGHLASYFAAFARDDKESYKLIQAASYAHSFLAFAQRTGVLSSADGIRPLVVGYTSRGVNSMALRSEHWGVLAACHKVGWANHTRWRLVPVSRKANGYSSPMPIPHIVQAHWPSPSTRGYAVTLISSRC